MKSRNLLFSLLFVFSAQIGFSQVQQGAILLGGQFSFEIENNENNSNNNQSFIPNKTTTFSIQPQIGYALSENLIIGSAVGYNFTKT